VLLAVIKAKYNKNRMPGARDGSFVKNNKGFLFLRVLAIQQDRMIADPESRSIIYLVLREGDRMVEQ
jgi:hypothetical protein